MFFSIKRNFQKNRGFGLVETLVAVTIFSLVAFSVYAGFTQILKVMSVLKIKNLAVNLVNEQIEIVRNLPYSEVGIIEGLPLGKIPRKQNILKEGVNFEITTSIQDFDDPFDGVIGGSPNDLSPADYKIVEFTLQCKDCTYPEPVKYYTRVSPENLENQGNNGALFIRVFDADGHPVVGANVNVVNNQTFPSIDIDEITNNNGLFQIVDAPTGTSAYKINVSKNGYSTDKTYTIGSSENPNPYKTDATIASGQVTQLSFAIDKLSDLTVKTKNTSCEAVPNLDFKISGLKLIGENILKYTSNKETDENGIKNILGLEWDNYFFEILNSSYDLAGSNHLLPLTVRPNNNQDLDLIVMPSDPKSLLVQVIDGQTNLPLADAQVKISDINNNVRTLITGKGFISQTDWFEGAGQEIFYNQHKYFSQNGNIDTSNPSGVLKLIKIGNEYLPSGELISSTFDLVTTTNFGILTWGSDQPLNTEVKIQIATNEIVNATTTWNFIGPDGTNNTYYTSPDQNINPDHNGDQYVRYKIFLSSSDPNTTPQISNIAFTYNTECAPLGQVLFQNLNSGNYSLEIIKDGYQTYSVQNISINENWQNFNVLMTP